MSNIDEIIMNLYAEGFTRNEIVDIINDDPLLDDTNYDHVKYIIRDKVILELQKRGKK